MTGFDDINKQDCYDVIICQYHKNVVSFSRENCFTTINICKDQTACLKIGLHTKQLGLIHCILLWELLSVFVRRYGTSLRQIHLECWRYCTSHLTYKDSLLNPFQWKNLTTLPHPSILHSLFLTGITICGIHKKSEFERHYLFVTYSKMGPTSVLR